MILPNRLFCKKIVYYLQGLGSSGSIIIFFSIKLIRILEKRKDPEGIDDYCFSKAVGNFMNRLKNLESDFLRYEIQFLADEIILMFCE